MIKCFKHSNLLQKGKYSSNIFNNKSYTESNSEKSNDKIKVEWKTYNWKDFDRQFLPAEKYKNITYEQQLKMKKEDFVKAFKNVLITLNYDEKLDDELREKQQIKGENICKYIEPTQPLSSTLFKNVLTSDTLVIGDDINGKKKIGKYTRLLEAVEHEDTNDLESENATEDLELEYAWQSKLTKLHENDYPQDFKLISDHFEEFIKENPLPIQKFASYYTTFWNWSKIELRKSRDNQNMLIVPFNPQTLSGEAILEQKNNLKDYFLNGPGRECNLSSLYFHILDRKHEYNLVKKNFELLFGSDKLVETCDGKEFNFFADNFYPQVYECYEKLNTTLVSMLETAKIENGTDNLIELDGANGVLGTLISKSYNKFSTIQNCFNTTINTRANLEKHDLKENDYFWLSNNLSKSMRHLKMILSHSSEDSRFCFVFQDFKQPALDYQKQYKKKLLIHLRAHKQIKSILLVTNVATLFKLEQYCYELMTAERKRDGIFGEPFCAVSAKLIDLKPNVSSCYIITRLDRD